MGQSIKVLIVEDSENDAALLISALQRGGYDPAYEIVETPEDWRQPLHDQAGQHPQRPESSWLYQEDPGDAGIGAGGQMKIKSKSRIIISSIMLLLILAAVWLAAVRLPAGSRPITIRFPSGSSREVSILPATVHSSRTSKLLQTSLQRQLQVPSTYNDQVAVLMYHDVQPDSNNTITVTPQRLDADLTLLQQEGFHIIPISQMAAFMEHRATIPEKAVALTFDDGYEGVYRYALPVLQKHHAPATIFLIGYYVGNLPGYLTWSEVRQLEASGLVTVGGHTYNQHVPEPAGESDLAEPATIDHLFNPKTGQEETEQECEARMLSDSQLLQETFKNELGHTTIYFAYPYGAYNATFIKILHETGFRYMFTTQTGVNGINDDPASLFRIDAGATWIATKKIPSLILKTAYYSSSEKQSQSYLPEWKV
jgi:peptidoglycan/xylan/chitin deacetylase (PgdA/CDA1 family)